jgi:transitional endoplasmic reticulum ATPase
MTSVYRCPDGTDKDLQGKGTCDSGFKAWGEPGRCPVCEKDLIRAPDSWHQTQSEPPLPPLDNASAEADNARRVQIERSGDARTVLVPETMTLPVAIHALKRQMDYEEEIVEIMEEVECHPLDGARALMQVLKRRYGWVDAQSYEVETMFGKVDIKPEVVSLEVDFGKYEQILWGALAIPGVSTPLRTGATNKGTKRKPRFIFFIGGEIKRKYEALVQAIAKEVRREIAENSIYRGKAFRLITDDEGNLNPTAQPTFMDTSKANPDDLILNEDTMTDVRASIFTPICKTELVRSRGVPLKRGVLLYGVYGTGKTMTAHCTARLARENHWTFVYLDRPEALPQAIQFCSVYGPTVIFAEDIDRVVGEQRDEVANNILNTIDGIDSKGSDVMVILTTNHVRRIYPAMLRPGRLDHKIHIAKPDADAVARLIRLYAGDNLPDNTDIGTACEALDGQIPAVIAEAVKRATLYSAALGETNLLSGEALAMSARSMKTEIDLMDDAQRPKTISREEALGKATSELVNEAVVSEIKDTVVTELEKRI